MPGWVKIEAVKDVNQQTLLEVEVDRGEASAIALAIETSSLLILDESEELATKLNLPFTGTLGVILKAKQAGIIPAIKPILEKIQHTDFRFSDNIFKEILKSSNEL